MQHDAAAVRWRCQIKVPARYMRSNVCVTCQGQPCQLKLSGVAQLKTSQCIQAADFEDCHTDKLYCRQAGRQAGDAAS